LRSGESAWEQELSLTKASQSAIVPKFFN